jgi:hypothetical protein
MMCRVEGKKASSFRYISVTKTCASMDFLPQNK